MVIIRNKDVVAEKLNFVSRKLKYVTRIMKRNPDDTKATEHIVLCKNILEKILEDDIKKDYNV